MTQLSITSQISSRLNKHVLKPEKIHVRTYKSSLFDWSTVRTNSYPSKARLGVVLQQSKMLRSAVYVRNIGFYLPVRQNADAIRKLNTKKRGKREEKRREERITNQ